MINERYLGREFIFEARESFKKSIPRMIRIDNFLDSDSYFSIGTHLERRKRADWKIPDKHSFTEFTLSEEYFKLFTEGEFAAFMREVCELPHGKIDVMIKRYCHGDYSLLADTSESARADFYIVFTPDDWEIEFGGSRIYPLEDGESVILPPVDNSLFIIESSSLGSFQKYINHLAKDRCIIIVEGRIS